MKNEFGSEDWARAEHISRKLERETEEAYFRLHSLQAELSEDPNMRLVPESYVAVEYLGYAAGRLYRLQETTDSLHSILSPVQTEYDEMERQIRNKIFESGTRLWKI